MTQLDHPDTIRAFRLATLKAALRLECLGMKRSHPPSALSALRTMGYKGNRARILDQVTKDLDAWKEGI